MWPTLTLHIVQIRIPLDEEPPFTQCMSFPDVVLLVIRWIHALAAVAWVGGGLFYLLILRPNVRAEEPGESLRALGEQFRSLVYTTMAILLVTGVILMLTRLTSEYIGTAYVVVLVVKIVLSLYMFYLVRFLRPRTYPEEPSAGVHRIQRLTTLFTGATAVLMVGVIVFLLADILRALVEKGIEG